MKRIFCTVVLFSMLLTSAAGLTACGGDGDRPDKESGVTEAQDGTAESGTSANGDETDGSHADNATGSVGLEYFSNGDGTCRVLGIGTCTDTDVAPFWHPPR